MLDSVRVRLTVWYSAVLAVVLVLVSATTYLIVRKTSMQRTDADLAVLGGFVPGDISGRVGGRAKHGGFASFIGSTPVHD